ncbi:DgyrCDS10734 [Dimorphilus gyrociliatus]|uniref:DgyrCDS10734 n=1 Tax=Dimorphilus gyrociliatus TaxID=2664684 RepID=A0A7I8W156_9ANNE|nr:DgyrCDS10734 [Dimorphilus gyrociliatus]
MFSLKEIALQVLIREPEVLFKLPVKKTKSIYLPMIIADEILQRLDHLDVGIAAKYLKFFSSNCCILKNVAIHGNRIKKASLLSFLRGHRLESLSVHHLTTFDVKFWLTFAEKEHLKELSLKGCEIKKGSSIMVPFLDYEATQQEEWLCILQLKNLVKLDLSRTKVGDVFVESLSRHLYQLEEINMSQTHLKNLYLFNSFKSLHSLDCSNCDVSGGLHRFHKKLKRFDMSHFPAHTLNDYPVYNFIKNVDWPQLTYFDVTCCGNIPGDILIPFIKRHPKLKFLGVLQCNFDDVIQNHQQELNSINNRNLVILAENTDWVKALNYVRINRTRDEALVDYILNDVLDHYKFSAIYQYGEYYNPYLHAIRFICCKLEDIFYSGLVEYPCPIEFKYRTFVSCYKIYKKFFKRRYSPDKVITLMRLCIEGRYMVDKKLQFVFDLFHSAVIPKLMEDSCFILLHVLDDIDFDELTDFEVLDFDSHFTKFKQTSEEIIVNLKDRITETAVVMVEKLNTRCSKYLELRPASKRRLRKRAYRHISGD